MTDRTNYCAGCHAREHLLESVALDAEGTRTQRDRAVELLEVAQELLHESGIRVDDLDAFLAKQERKPCACTNKEVDGAFVGESCDRCAPPMKLEREPCQRCGGKREAQVGGTILEDGTVEPIIGPCPDCAPCQRCGGEKVYAPDSRFPDVGLPCPDCAEPKAGGAS